MKFPGKILDRHIFVNVTGTFLFGIALFMALLLAMDLLEQLIKMIAEKGVPAITAEEIFAFRIPSMLVYAFPMSVLLGILLVFNQMSSDSEMVAIRASGISFVRIVAPTVAFALVITGLTFWISNCFAPFANKQATHLLEIALRSVKKSDPVSYPHIQNGNIDYSIQCADLDVNTLTMHKVTLTFFTEGVPSYVVYADTGYWKPQEGHWNLPDAYPYDVRVNSQSFRMTPLNANSELDIKAHVLQVMVSPFDLEASKQSTDDLTPRELQADIAQKIARYTYEPSKDNATAVGQSRMALAKRFATPFYCLVFALIAAPLGLRHHRTSSAMGLGISLLILFAFFFSNVYLSTLGQSGCMPTDVAAWIPNVVGGILGVVLIARANN